MIGILYIIRVTFLLKKKGKNFVKKYKVLLTVICAELILFFALAKNGIKVQTSWGNAVGVFIAYLPIELLLWDLSKNVKVSNRIRVCSKIAFWYIIICYLAGAIATFIASM